VKFQSLNDMRSRSFLFACKVHRNTHVVTVYHLLDKLHLSVFVLQSGFLFSHTL
jgi:hypothetical protein